MIERRSVSHLIDLKVQVRVTPAELAQDAQLNGEPQGSRRMA
jgi:hypothetical protein